MSKTLDKQLIVCYSIDSTLTIEYKPVSSSNKAEELEQMKYVVVNKKQGFVYKFIIAGLNKRIFRTRTQAKQNCKEINWSFPDSKFTVVRCKSLKDCGYEVIM